MNQLNAFHARIADQYEAFPFPYFEVIEAEDPSGELSLSLNLDLRLPKDRWFTKPRIWVAGASTRAAVQIALQHRSAEVIGSDLSRTSIALQSKVAEQLGLKNLEIRRQDLTKAGYANEFDYVSCVGVIMILDSPEAGLQAIARALRKKSGVAEIMLYGRIARADAMRSQEILRTVAPKVKARERMELASRLFGSLRVGRLGEEHPLVKMGRDLGTSDKFRLNDLADVITHPYERAYDVDETYALMESARLRIRHWKNPALTRPERYVTSERLAARMRDLDERQRMQLAYLLGYPLLEFFVDRAGDRLDVVPIEEQPILDFRLRPLTHYLRHRFDGDRLVSTRKLPRLKKHPNGFKVSGLERRPGVSAYAADRVVPPVAARLLALADGRRTAGDILVKLGREEGFVREEKAGVERLLRALLLPHSRLFSLIP
jgi:SAM-dependent methyltransferase